MRSWSKDPRWQAVTRDIWGSAAVWAAVRGLEAAELAERIKSRLKRDAGAASTKHIDPVRFAALWDRFYYDKTELGLLYALGEPYARPLVPLERSTHYGA